MIERTDLVGGEAALVDERGDSALLLLLLLLPRLLLRCWDARQLP
jgi:hypothetical protein